MGFLRWIKRELDTTGHFSKRRQSEPPPSVNQSKCNPNISRDEAYLKALTKFNEWRTKQRIGSCGSGPKKRPKIPTQIYEEEERNPQEGELEATSADQNTSNDCSNNLNLYEEIDQFSVNTSQTLNRSRIASPNISHEIPLPGRHSAPMKCGRNSKKYSKMGNGKMNKERSIIDAKGVTDFENNHCQTPGRQNNFSDDRICCLSSPPVKFYKINSNPFKDVASPNRSKPKSIYAMPKKILRNSMSENRNSSTYMQDSLSPPYTPSKDFQTPQCGQQQGQHKEKPHRRKYLNVPSANYQMVVNKHGDLVEYALPYNEPDPEIVFDQDKCEDIIEENFKFLERSPFNENINSRTFTQNRSNVIITDLDKSDGTLKIEGNYNRIGSVEGIEELNTLEQWSKNILNGNKEIGKSHPVNDVPNNGPTFCNAFDIEYRANSIKNNSVSNVLFSSGTFRSSPVTARSFIYSTPASDSGQYALLQDFEILRQIQHPDIAILMAACIDGNKCVNSLVLEPFRCTLHQLIHENDSKISISNCIEYALQVTRAAIYLQESGYVHSNISSSTVLICESVNCAKLTSFELSTNMKANIQNEIIVHHSDLIDENLLPDDYKIVNKFKSFMGDDARKYSNKNSNIERQRFPKAYLPYSTEHRQMYVTYFYQPPELLSLRSAFVFPIKQSDVYGITLMLWEMLNDCVPFAIFTQAEMEKLFCLKQAQLPTFEGERCKAFQGVLQQGLAISPKDRLENVKELMVKLECIRDDIGYNQSVSKMKTPPSCKSTNLVQTPDFKDSSAVEFANLLSPGVSRNGIYEKTSTIKRQKNKNRKSKQIDVVEFFKNTVETSAKNIAKSDFVQPVDPEDKNRVSKSLDNIFHLNGGNRETKEYQFEIDKVSLPNTQLPIARQNKLRRTAWLTNKKLSPVQSTPEELPLPTLTPEKNDEKFNNRRENFGMKKVNVNIKIVHNKVMNNEESPPALDETEETEEICQSVLSQIDFWNSLTSPGIAATTNNVQNEESISEAVEDLDNFQITEPPQYYPNMPELLSEAFHKRSRSKEKDFESMLWKREKQLCELLSTSAAVTHDQNESGVVTPRQSSVRERVNIFESFTRNNLNPRDYENNANNLVIEEVKNSNQFEDPELNISKLTVTLSNNLDATRKTSSFQSRERSLPEMNIVLDTQTEGDPSQWADNSKDSLDVRNSTASSGNKTLLMLNLKKLSRRLSIGGESQEKPSSQEEKFQRHSIGGTDVFKNIGKLAFISSDKIEPVRCCGSVGEERISEDCQNGEASLDCSKEDKKVADLTCWNCGSHIFVVDETEDRDSKNHRPIMTNQVSSSTMDIEDTRRSSTSKKQDSTEDLYIDDDFNQGRDLGANMELGTDILNSIDFDVLSAEIYNRCQPDT